MASSKFKIENFVGKTNFGFRQRRMKNILIQQGIKVALLGKIKKPTMIDDDDCANLDEKAFSSIQQYLSDEVMFNVMDEEIGKDL
ncbi:hypothetical protein MRB53_002596 [Persea americana]|uniref:Uncharacterized protein n=1 Tax=Persea americana TaxID=3435 RepID=A0ACC2MVW1_PERAE|nr:hypothetical protein MRB53_002596 [Persea americana]